MNSGNCQRESQVVAAVQAGEWSAELRGHLAYCSTCAEAALVAEFLQTEQRTAGLPAQPSAGQVWWKAQIRARREDAERALKPVWAVQRISSVCLLLAALFLIVRFGPQLQHWLNDLSEGAFNTSVPMAEVFLASAIAVVAVVSAGLTYLLHSSK
jgi:hypothetical protein